MATRYFSLTLHATDLDGDDLAWALPPHRCTARLNPLVRVSRLVGYIPNTGPGEDLRRHRQ